MLRAVIYCRCSTEEESQKEALKKQVLEAKESVKANGWILADEYIESKSGTTAEKRKEYQRLFEDLQTGKFDVVQIKSQDRLMRNTKDWYLFVDRLVTNNKKLYMYMDQKFYTPDDALITGIKAILAEEYSKELSKKMNNAHKNRQLRGDVFILPSDTYGYKKLPDKSIVIVEEEAKIIRLMFHLCESMGCKRIASVLVKEGYLDRRGNVFQEETIRGIIRNPVRCGTIVQNKRHFDFQLKKEFKVPKEEWIIHKNAVPAIVTEETWKKANDAMDNRAEIFRIKKGYSKIISGNSDLSGKIRCGFCGGIYYRTHRKRQKDQIKITEWKCRKYLRNGKKGCDNLHIEEAKLYCLLKEIHCTYYKNYEIDEKSIMKKTMSILKSVINKSGTLEKCRELEQEINKQKTLSQKLVDKLLGEIISDNDFKLKKAEINEKLRKLREELNQYQSTDYKERILKNRIEKIESNLKTGILNQAVLSVMIEDIEQIIVYKDKLKVQFISGQLLEVQLDNDFTYVSRKEAEREKIIKYMKENPEITAKKIAEIEKISLTTANYRIRKLREEGKVYFNGRGGHGQWIVCEKKEGTSMSSH